MFRHWGSVPYLHMRHPLQGWEHPQASRQHGSTVPGQAGTASGFCVLLQALGVGVGGSTLLSLTLPSQATTSLYLKGALFHFSLTMHLLYLISFLFFHYLHVHVLWIKTTELKSMPPLFRIPHRTWTKEIAEMKKRRDWVYLKVEQVDAR